MPAVKTASDNGEFLCTRFQEAFQMLGKKWNGMIIEALLIGDSLRFCEISEKIENCSDRVLTARLKELRELDLIVRKTFQDSSLIKYELTEKGRDLAPIMSEVHGWADKWCDGDEELDR
ncbi:winged helix-turn-helix transcriptional regulator [Fructilactobacillus florum]|uniref:HTH-type transcriptional regulator YodB n=1 Tax=Fructilactobacillus florum DSM 22689 = JCM 16035 TaxID=1423745 RepID=A0A0R2CKJ4_9LACO|nr:helix-turn-helix domain-containing protein [Fructilactobacillus florum]EKK20698.1 putative transcriptional regulator [Fructilactobacillus florum 2F]KRM91818.1 HTH-type transcriptional regulator YodB [Fructilactobacillus florum DSM 22689 = JCM 16035]